MSNVFQNMIATKNPLKSLPKIPSKNIPSTLIYEIMDGKPIYFNGYREVIEGTKTIEEVMGASNLQSTIIEYILRVLFKNLDENLYRILTNEIGLHLNKKNNLSGDIVIYEKTVLPVQSADKHYISIPPKIQIEVDIDADMQAFGTPDNYIYAKTDKLLAFGVEKVIWVISSNKKVLVAENSKDWSVIDWNKDIEIIDGILINVGKFLKENNSSFA